jgi:IclR family transcriptional regulator, pca regulon regulatory protein
MSSSRSEIVESFARGLSVIEAFSEGDLDMTLSDVVRKTSLQPATVRRSLRTLVKLGYAQVANGRYLLSARVLALGSAYLRSSNVESILMPTLRRLAEQFQDSAGIAIRVDTSVLYVAHHYVPQGGIRQVAGAGVRYPAHATSLGRVLLAHAGEKELDQWLSGTVRNKHTEFTVTEARQLRMELKRVRSRGYATVRDQLFLGVTAIAVPISDSCGNVVAALNSSAYSGLFSEADLVRERLRALNEAAAEVSALVMRHPALLSSFLTDRAPEPHGIRGPSPGGRQSQAR